MVWRRSALATLLTFGGLGVQGVQLQSTLARLAKAQKEEAHAALFEKDFTVELDMIAAHERNLNLGVQLDTDTDFTPVSVAKVRKNGLMETWNKAHPDRAILVGDQIMKVNDILWHHNSQMFAERIKNQYKAYKEYKPGAKRVLTMAIQRPRHQKEVRYQSQREDLHRQMYSKEFTVDLPFVEKQTIGWTLNATVDWNPVTIANLSSTGLVALWNQENPENRIYPGDEIVMANNISWHHNTKVFKNRIDTMLRRTMTQYAYSARNSKVAISLRIQRPRSVVETLESKIFHQTWRRPVQFNYSRGWAVEIPARVNQLLGLRLNASDNEVPVTVDLIRRLSAASVFNEDNPDDALMPGDQIFKVNDVLWRGNSREFAQRLEQQFAKSKRTGVMRLWIQRPEGLQPEDESSLDYLEFSTELNVSSPKAMGWELNTTGAGPVSISKLTNLGSISSWNENNPLKDVQVGDQLIQVDNNIWHNNTEIFMKHLGHQLADAASTKGKGSIAVLFRRPYEVTNDDETDGKDEEVGGDVMGAEE
jgi:hypothetical protein